MPRFTYPSGEWATFVLKKKEEEITSPERPGIRHRGRANGTARLGLKRAPDDINTGFGDSNIGVDSGARPNPNLSIYGSSNMMDTTSTNNDQFHSPVNVDGMGGSFIDPDM